MLLPPRLEISEGRSAYLVHRGASRLELLDVHCVAPVVFDLIEQLGKDVFIVLVKLQEILFREASSITKVKQLSDLLDLLPTIFAVAIVVPVLEAIVQLSAFLSLIYFWNVNRESVTLEGPEKDVLLQFEGRIFFLLRLSCLVFYFVFTFHCKSFIKIF